MLMEEEVRMLRELVHKLEAERDHYKDLAKDLEDKISNLENEIDNMMYKSVFAD